MKNLFQEFGARFELGQFHPLYQSNKKAIVPAYAVPGKYHGMVLHASWVAVCYWCEGDFARAEKYAKECVAHAVEYFFGNWRREVKTDLKTIDPEWWRIHATWVDPFRTALCWASYLNDWRTMQHLAEYPSRGCKHGVDATPEDAAACLALASLLRNRPAHDYEHCFALIECGRKRKAKLVANVIRALQKRNEAVFQECLVAYLVYFRKSEFKRTAIDSLLCMDGTTLLHLGVRVGLTAKLPQGVEDHIIRKRESVG